MPLWSDYLQTVEIPAVTQIRASNDYQSGLEPSGNQVLFWNFILRISKWSIGKSSIVAWALGLFPFKDVFWTTSKQPGNPYGPQ